MPVEPAMRPRQVDERGIVEGVRLVQTECVKVGGPKTVFKNHCKTEQGKPMVFFAISAVPARPSAGIGVVDVQKLEVFLRFLRCSRNPLCCSNWSSGVVSWFARQLQEISPGVLCRNPSGTLQTTPKPHALGERVFAGWLEES